MDSRLQVIIAGSVQGVFFRAGTVSEAKKLGLVGWVRNVEDGSVEVMAEGERSALESLLDWCYHGPEGAVVASIEYRWLEATGEFGNFSVKYD